MKLSISPILTLASVVNVLSLTTSAANTNNLTHDHELSRGRLPIPAAANMTNVIHNHQLFQGRLPDPALFGLEGYVPLSTVGHNPEPGTKIYPDLAHAQVRGPHGDFMWERHGIPSYLATTLDLPMGEVMANSYRIVPTAGSSDGEGESKAIYKVVKEGNDPVVEWKPQGCEL